MTRVLHRPPGGWPDRTRRGDPVGWLLLAFVVVGSWVALNMLAGAVGVVAERFSLRQTVTPHDFPPPR
jgi:hypothetical protein